MRASGKNPFLEVEALGSFRRARAADPRLLPARYNFALVLQSLSLTLLAQREWQAFRSRTSGGGPHADQAEGFLRVLGEPTDRERWRRDLPALYRAAERGERDRVFFLVAADREAARREIEEMLLPAWGRAILGGDSPSAARALAVAAALADALSTLGADPWLRDLVSALPKAGAAPAEVRRIAAALADYGQGLQQIERSAFGDAELVLARSASTLEALAPPLHLAVLLRLAYSLHQQSLYERSIPIEQALIEDAERRGYRALSAMAHRYRGSAYGFQGLVELALESHTQAFTLFSELGERGNLVSSLIQLSDALEGLGRPQEAWGRRVAALRAVGELGDPTRARSVLGLTARSLAESDPETALLFADEQAFEAETTGRGDDVAAAQRLRGALLLHLGRLGEAERAITAALAAIAHLAQQEDRELALAETLPIEAEIVARREPARALESLSGTLTRLAGRPYHAQESRVTLLRALVYEEQGDLVHAERDLLRAIELEEAAREGLVQSWNRVGYLDRWSRPFDELARFRLEHGQGASAALDAVERSRGRSILEWTRLLPRRQRMVSSSPRTPSIRELQSRLPSSLTVLEYRFLGRGLGVWRIDRERVGVRLLPLTVADLRAATDRLRSSLVAPSARARAGFEESARRLFRDLLEPLAADGPLPETLVLIPDGPLWDLPWGALRTPEGRYLVEDHLVSLAPSLAVLVRPEAERPGHPPRALLIAGDRPDPASGLPALPSTGLELEELRRMYPKAVMLRGEEATTGAFLAALPAAEIVQFSGHTIDVAGSPLQSALVLARDEESGAGGVLRMSQLLGEALPGTRLVVLSACSAAAGAASRSEGRLSLALPFLARGVRQVVVTYWGVRDSVGSRFSLAFHQRLVQGIGPAEALRATQLEMLRSRDPALRPPRVWAAFHLIGSLSQP